MGNNIRHDFSHLLATFNTPHNNSRARNEEIIREAQKIITKVNDWLEVGKILQFHPAPEIQTRMNDYKVRAQEIITKTQKILAEQTRDEIQTPSIIAL
jgi:hypothetical protein